MKNLFRFLAVTAFVCFLLDKNWLAAVWVFIALTQHERAELILRRLS